MRTFDLETGRQGADIEVPGAGFLNDLVAAMDGTLYVSDTSVRAAGDGFEPTGTGAVYEISPEGTVRPLAQGADLGLPNGLAGREYGKVLVSTLYRFA